VTGTVPDLQVDAVVTHQRHTTNTMTVVVLRADSALVGMTTVAGRPRVTTMTVVIGTIAVALPTSTARLAPAIPRNHMRLVVPLRVVTMNPTRTGTVVVVVLPTKEGVALHRPVAGRAVRHLLEDTRPGSATGNLAPVSRTYQVL
jgi:hypothetical protein